MPLLVFQLDGSIQAAILMTISGKRLRVFMPALDDAVEFRWQDGQWEGENGEPVEIEFDAAPDEFARRAQTAVQQPAIPRETLTLCCWPAFEAPQASALSVN